MAAVRRMRRPLNLPSRSLCLSWLMLLLAVCHSPSWRRRPARRARRPPGRRASRQAAAELYESACYRQQRRPRFAAPFFRWPLIFAVRWVFAGLHDAGSLIGCWLIAPCPQRPSCLVGLGLLMVLAASTVWRAARMLRDAEPRLKRGVGVAALMAICSIGLHGMVDFNLQIPANAFTLVLLMALVWATPDNWTLPTAQPRQ